MIAIEKAKLVSLPYIIAVTLLAAIAALSVVRGSADNINSHVMSYYVANYDDGLIRRGLVGEVFSWFVPQHDLATVQAAMVAMYVPLVVVLLASLFAWVLAIEYRRRDFLFLSLFAVFLSSQFVPTLAFDVGFLDVFTFLLITAAAAALAYRRLWIVAVVGAVGPFVHESYVFYWLPLLVVGLWKTRTLQRGLVMAVPFASAAVVYLGASLEVAAAQMAASVLPEESKREALVLQFGQTFLSNLHMLSIKYRNNLANTIAAFFFFAAPAVVIVGLYAAARRKRGELAVLAFAAMAPLLILAIAWDLSRFLVNSIFSAWVAALYMETVLPAGRVSWPFSVVSWIVAAILAQVPFTYAYFEVAAMRDVGPAFLRSAPIGRLTQVGVSIFSRAIGPTTSDRHGSDPLPSGDLWFVEEDVWRGAWVRRPGTNVFDAVMTLPGGAVVTYIATVERDGGTIIARRNLDVMGAVDRMDYVGTLKGKAISGTYPGGHWSARIN